MGLEIDLLAVGNNSKSGDAIMLRYGDLKKGKGSQAVILIDGGYAQTAEKIKEYLSKYYNCKQNGKYVIDLAILTHPDIDHASGLVELAKDDEIEILNVLMRKPWDELDPSFFKDGRITEKSLNERLKSAFTKAAELEENTEDACHMNPSPGEFECEGATFTILGPSDDFYCELMASCDKTPDSGFKEAKSKVFSVTEEEKYVEGQQIKWNYDEYTSNINESSFIILFEYNKHRILFTGDTGKRGLSEAIQYAENNGIDLSNIEVIIMPHHGSRKNVSPEIMDVFKGNNTRCYISCVDGDDGHHPSKRLVNMLKNKGFTVFTTQGSNLWRHHDAPAREGFSSAKPLEYYKTIEKL